jgi:hypothetical protein
MRTLRAVGILLVATLSAVAVAVAAPPLADKVPAGSLAYIGWAGRNLTFDGSLFGQLLNEPEILALVQDFHKTLRQRMAEPGEAASFEGLWSMAALAWQHPLAVALLDVQDSPAGEKEFSAVLLVDLGRDRETFAKALDKVIASQEPGTSIVDTTLETATFKTFQPAQGKPVAFGFLGDVFFVALGADTPRKLIHPGTGGVLAADVRFNGYYSAVTGENEQLVFYADIAGLVNRAEPPAAAGASQPTSSDAPRSLRRTLAAMGLADAKALCGSYRIVDRGLYAKVRLFSPAPHRGLLLPFAGAQLAENDLSGVPDDAVFALAIKLPPEAAYAELARIYQEISPPGQNNLDALAEEFRKTSGVSIREDVLANLGDTWVLASAPSLGGFLTGTTLSVQVRDAAKFAVALDRLERHFFRICEPATQAAQPAAPDEDSRLALNILKNDRGDVHYLSLPGGMPVAPAWTLADGRFTFALWPQVAQMSRSNPARKTLLQDPQFRQFRSKLPERCCAMAYVNPSAVIAETYNFMLAAWTVASSTSIMGGESPVRQNWLPTLSAIQKYLPYPDMAVVTSDDAGITMESFGSLPVGGLGLSPLLTPLGAAAGFLMGP